MSEEYNTVLFVKRGVNPITANVSVVASLKGRVFQINSDPNPLTMHFQNGIGEEVTNCNRLFLSFSVEGHSNAVFEAYDFTLTVTSFVSLLLGDLYLDFHPQRRYAVPGATLNSLSSSIPEIFSSPADGFAIDNTFRAKNSDIQNFLTRINKLTYEDSKRYFSSSYLLNNAKKSLAAGEVSASVADCIASLEALYVEPNARGIYRNIDKRFSQISQDMGLGTMLRAVFLDGSQRTKELSLLYDRIDPYKLRSGHLHSGKIQIHNGSFPRKKDIFDDFLLRCEDVVLSSLSKFGV